MNPILGIDVAKAKLDVSLCLPDGKIRSKVVDNTPDGFATLLAWLTPHGGDRLHACGSHRHLLGARGGTSGASRAWGTKPSRCCGPTRGHCVSLRRKPPMVIIGTMMRKLVHVAYSVFKSGKPFNPDLHLA